ncbi:MAG: transporter substrate-binding domain-containing protein [Clostridia bacterium]|nr:transporter substrate-binding domain-containing protein [Clostridia bacterium]
MKKIIAVMALLAMVLCMFAGCAKTQETITVGYTIVDPLNYMDENGKLVGFDTELAEKVFGNLGYKVIFKEIEWSAKYTELDSKSIDCIWNGFTANTSDDDGIARADKVDFSYNYMENRQVLVAKKDNTIKALEDLKGKNVAAEKGSAGDTYVNAVEGIVFKGVTKQTDAHLEVMSGTADVAVVDAQLAKAYVGQGDYADLAIVEGVSSDVEYYAIGFRKGSELTANVNEQLDKLAQEGYIAELAEKYDVASTTITDYSDQK